MPVIYKEAYTYHEILYSFRNMSHVPINSTLSDLVVVVVVVCLQCGRELS